MFSSTKTVTSTSSFSERKEWLGEQIAEADYVLIGAGAGLTTAAGIDYAGEDFRREFREWTDRYGITDLYSAGFYPFETDEERWAMWAKHIWFSRYRTGALPLYKKLLKMVDGKDYFVITTNVDGQFEMAGFDTDRIFATQGDYCYFQPASGAPKELYHNRKWNDTATSCARHPTSGSCFWSSVWASTRPSSSASHSSRWRLIFQMLLSSALTETTHSRLYKESRV